MEAVRSSAVGKNRDRRLEPFSRILESTLAIPRSRARALSEMDDLASADLTEARARHGRRAGACRQDMAHSSRRAKHRMVAKLCIETRVEPQGCARRHRGNHNG